MMTLFKSQDLWDLVENGYADPDEESRLKENKKKDSKALFFIQQAVHESIFSKNISSNHFQTGLDNIEDSISGFFKGNYSETSISSS